MEQHTPNTFLLLNLPPEIRDKIYGFAIASDEAHPVIASDAPCTSLPLLRIGHLNNFRLCAPVRLGVAALVVCNRQISTEIRAALGRGCQRSPASYQRRKVNIVIEQDQTVTITWQPFLGTRPPRNLELTVTVADVVSATYVNGAVLQAWCAMKGVLYAYLDHGAALGRMSRQTRMQNLHVEHVVLCIRFPQEVLRALSVTQLPVGPFLWGGRWMGRWPPSPRRTQRLLVCRRTLNSPGGWVATMAVGRNNLTCRLNPIMWKYRAQVGFIEIRDTL